MVVASGTTAADGTVTLSPIRYEAPGTHTYTLREACPNALGLYKGVTYDGTTYTVVTTVSDNGDGTLTATHKLEGTTESAGFTNKYHAMPTQVSIGAIKVLEGRELKKDEFSFKLVGEGIEFTVTNDADGKISFDKFEYDEPGTHVYTISEVKGDDAGMTYDKSVFTATVNVVDDGEGNLKANVAFTKGDTRDEAETAAARVAAPPGTSAHQTGLGADIVDQYYSSLSVDMNTYSNGTAAPSAWPRSSSMFSGKRADYGKQDRACVTFSLTK